MSSTSYSRGFLARCHRASSLDGLCDTMSSSMAEEGARRLGAAKDPSPAVLDDTLSSSTALAVFSGSASSSIGWRRLFLLGVVKRRCTACLTTRCRRARFFVTYYALGFSPAPLAPNFVFDDSPPSGIGKARLLRRSVVKHAPPVVLDDTASSSTSLCQTNIACNRLVSFYSVLDDGRLSSSAWRGV